jgi:hypothetical protein
MQGYLFSRPLAAEEFVLLLERESAGGGEFSLLRQLCASYGERSVSELAVDIANS